MTGRRGQPLRLGTLRLMNPEATPKLVTEKAYVDIKELRARTGLSLSTLHRLKTNGKIPCYQPAGKGGRLLFPANAIERCATATAQEQTTLEPSASEPRDHLSGRRPNWMQTTDTPQETFDHGT